MSPTRNGRDSFGSSFWSSVQLWAQRNDVVYELKGCIPLGAFFLVSGVMNMWVENYVNSRVTKETQPLNDLFLDWFPLLESAWPAYLLYIVFPTYTFFRTLYPRFRAYHAKLILFNISVLLLGRCLTIYVTNFPDPNPKCYERTVPEQSLDYLLLNIDLEYCGDAMYSGSTCVLFLCACYWQTFSKKTERKIVGWSLAFLGACLAMATRQHYSMDVVIAIYMTISLWYAVLFFSEIRDVKWFKSRREQENFAFAKLGDETEAEIDHL